MSLYEMRRSYELGTLLEKDVDPDPMVQFRTWLNQAAEGNLPEWVEINAMTLSTSDLGGDVTSRIVLLKRLDGGKFWFYTNYDSAKGRQIDANPRVSLCFLWQHIQRQVRIEGTVEKAPRADSVAYFHKRPRDSQFGAMVSQQSSVVESRDILEKTLVALKREHGDSPLACPEDWGGYCVTPTSVEFWQGRQSRLHDRLRYRSLGSRDKDSPTDPSGSDGPKWTIERLSP